MYKKFGKYLSYFKPFGSKQGFELLFYEKGKEHKRKIVITAGMDGDEFDGIWAAFKLAKIIDEKKIPVNLIIVPVANPSGFLQKTSFAKDDKYPKYFFPGKSKGSYSERLIHFLSKEIIFDANMWIDLHGGSSNEKLTPFLWGFETNNQEVNENFMRATSLLKDDFVVYQKGHKWEKVNNLEEKKISYIISEAGQLGSESEENQKIHISRVLSIVEAFCKKDTEAVKRSPVKINQYFVPKFTKWNPRVLAGDVVRLGQVLGNKNFFNLINSSIKTDMSGTVLWNKIEGRVTRNDSVCAIVESVDSLGRD
ncbi:succinylglutamate desuccinylase/aspartoacylase family protein [Patescibacteria group bacterium]